MALFSKEPEKNAKLQQVSNPQAQPAHAAAAAPAPVTEPKAPASAAASKPASFAPAEGRAYLDSGSKISGKLYFNTPARIDGQVEGEITAKESLTVGESAVVTAQIKASSVIVAGKVSGDITASHRIEIRPSAKILGNLTSPVLVIQEGALFEGHCAMEPEAARDDRKVTVFPKEERLAQAAGQKPA